MKKILVLLTALLLIAALCLTAVAETEVSAAIESGVAATEVTEETGEEPYTGLLSVSSMVTVGILLAAMMIALAQSAKRVKWNASMIAKAALCVALAYLLSMIRVWRAPMGGSVTLASLLPLVLFAVAFGPLEGVLIGFAFGLLQLMLDPYVIHPIQLLVDYPMAYGAVALAWLGMCLPLPDRMKLPAAVLLGYLGKYVMAVLSGVVFFAEYAGEQGALIYSLVYNISYVGPEALVCMVIACVPGMMRLPKLMRQNVMR